MTQNINLDIVDEVKWVASAGASPQNVDEIILDGTTIWPTPVPDIGDLILKVENAQYCELNEAGTEVYFVGPTGPSNFGISSQVTRYTDESALASPSGSGDGVPLINKDNNFSEGRIVIYGDATHNTGPANGSDAFYKIDLSNQRSNGNYHLALGIPGYSTDSNTGLNKGAVIVYEITPGSASATSMPTMVRQSNGGAKHRRYGQVLQANWVGDQLAFEIAVGSKYQKTTAGTVVNRGEVHSFYNGSGQPVNTQGPTGSSNRAEYIVAIARTGVGASQDAVIAVGGLYPDGFAGSTDSISVYEVSHHPNYDFTLKGSKITGINQRFGMALALDTTGDVLFACESGDEVKIYEYDNDASDWNLIQTISAPHTFNTPADTFGSSLDVVKRNDGKHVLAVGNPGDNGGYIYIYTEQNDGSYTLDTTISSGGKEFGKQVRLSKDGESRVVTVDDIGNGYLYNL